MFKKIISNLPFSPALVGQLGYYSKQLHKEKIARRLALIFVVLALAVQSLAVLEPPEPANASNVAINSNSQTQNDNLLRSVEATNASKGFVDATKVLASASDQISYTVTIANSGETVAKAKPEVAVSDILEYAEIIDNGGGILNTKAGTLSWPELSLDPATQQTRTFVIRLFSNIPATAQGTKNTKSYDCVISSDFGNTVNIPVECPTLKIVEQIITQLPKADNTANITFAIVVLATAAYFYGRSRQLDKEIRLIRKDVNAGTIY